VSKNNFKLDKLLFPKALLAIDKELWIKNNEYFREQNPFDQIKDRDD